jgi:hypothetical protein
MSEIYGMFTEMFVTLVCACAPSEALLAHDTHWSTTIHAACSSLMSMTDLSKIVGYRYLACQRVKF